MEMKMQLKVNCNMKRQNGYVDIIENGYVSNLKKRNEYNDEKSVKGTAEAELRATQFDIAFIRPKLLCAIICSRLPIRVVEGVRELIGTP
jgi:hypothetical protein